ncbi:MAG: hypothetical protein U9R53_10505 [Chloroflexota bacterium]|nr:hypothetical protein [Chloroflexota bacterium]
MMRNGGAGIHFILVRGRYRASFNFLEHPRVVISFKNKVGPILDFSFSTSRPEQLLMHLEEAINAGNWLDPTASKRIIMQYYLTISNLLC